MGKGRDRKKKKADGGGKAKNKEKEKKKREKNSNNKQEIEDDIDQILQDFHKNQVKMFQVNTEINCDPPSRRANATMIVNPLNQSELIMFGGEYFNGKTVQMYNDLYRYNIEKNEWRKFTCPNSPQPRSSHQMAATPGGLLFLWGGEFVSPNETSFFHYKDFWMLDLKTNEWEKLEVKGRPPPRSGHRIVIWKHFLVIFGGFFDTNKETRYYNDLWLFDTQTFTWINPETIDPPPPRSGFQFLQNGDHLIVYGGYCKATQKKNQKSVVVGTVYDDLWVLKMPHNLDFSQIRWERRKKPKTAGGLQNNVHRSGCTMVLHKSRGIMFGGVSDFLEDEEKIESVCYDDILQLNLDSNKWYPLTLRKKKEPGKSNVNGNQSTNRSPVYSGDNSEEDEWEKFQNELKNSEPFKEEDERNDKDQKPCDMNEQKLSASNPTPVILEAPCARFNTMLVISRNTLYLFGGTFILLI